MEYSIQEIAKITQGEVLGLSQQKVCEIIFDSRLPVLPANAMFVAIKGNTRDGHNHILSLAKRGVQLFLVEEVPDCGSIELGFVLVKNSLVALQKLAIHHRNQFDIPVVGITGSNGKTIIKEWIYQCLYDTFQIVRSPKSYNSQLGVPLSVLKLHEKCNLALFEAGISREDEMKVLSAIIKPSIGIFTNIGEAHQENFASKKQKAKEKFFLMQDCKTLIYCRDHTIVHDVISASAQAKLFTWGKHPESDIRILDEKIENNVSQISISYNNQKYNIELPFTDWASLENSMHVCSLLLILEISMANIVLRLKELVPVAMRLEQKQGQNNCTLINDTYNSDIDSLQIALKELAQQKFQRRSLILSDILQSSQEKEHLYRSIGEMVSAIDLHCFIGIGKDIYTYNRFFPKGSYFYSTTDEFLKQFTFSHFREEAILLKGARKFEFEKISRKLELQKHTTVLEINLESLRHNLQYFQALLKDGVKLMVMVKALGYGSGTYELANLLQTQGVDYLGVAYADEGAELRKSGITLPIMVMNPSAESFDLMFDYQLEPEIYSFSILENFIRALLISGKDSYPIHIKFDTGMHRLGFEPKDTEKLLTVLKNNPGIKVESVFSHLAASEDEQHDLFTFEQIQKLNIFCQKLNDEGFVFNKHILNSSGIERFPQYQFDMCRLGIGLYGVSAVSKGKLKNISRLRTVISQVKNIPAAETIGYSRRGKALKSVKIATIPIGYADGISRKLGNGVGKFLLNGKFVPTIGNICMDMCMLDISDVYAGEGDEVEIFGTGNSVSDLANELDTIPYEILTSISARVKRVYYFE